MMLYKKAIHVDESVVLSIMKECHYAVRYRSPFEADHQLAYMFREGNIDYVLTRDSDLFYHGCDVIRLDNKLGWGDHTTERMCDVYDQKLLWCDDLSKTCIVGSTHETFYMSLRKLCKCFGKVFALALTGAVLGNDYLKSGIKNIGLKKFGNFIDTALVAYEKSEGDKSEKLFISLMCAGRDDSVEREVCRAVICFTCGIAYDVFRAPDSLQCAEPTGTYM